MAQPPVFACTARIHYMHWLFRLAVLFASWCGSTPAWSQVTPELPRLEYYIARDLYDTGNIGEATEGFRVAMNRGQQVNQQRWIDSIPAIVMLGECYYQQGAIAQALEQYDAALMIALTFPSWVDAVLIPEAQADVPSELKGINWTKLSRRTQLVRVPATIQVALNPTAVKPGTPGGVAVAGTQLLRVDVCEVLRCLAISLQRRSYLLGPLARYSPLSEPVAQLFAKAPKSKSGWLQSSWRVLHGLSLLASGDNAQARAALSAGLSIDNQADYFLTPQCLLALAALDIKEGKEPTALGRLGDASLRAAQLEQAGTLADSLLMIGQLACAGRRSDLMPVLQSAVAWSQNYSILAYLSGSVALSELAVDAGNQPIHETTVNQILTLLNAKDVALPRIQAQLGYALARAAAAQNRLGLAHQHLETSMSMLRGNQLTGAATPRVFQTQLTLELLSRGDRDLPEAEALKVFRTLLSEPAEDEWRRWPLECLVSISTSHLAAYEKCLELVQRSSRPEDVVESMDKLQRERFLEVLPLGGRPLAVRQALHTPMNRWSPELVAGLEPALKNHPAAVKVVQSSRELLESMRKEPLAVEDRTITAEAKTKLAELSKFNEEEENVLMAMALRRGAIARHLPAPVGLPKLQESLDDRDVVLAFGHTSNSIIGVALTKQAEHVWSVPDSKAVDVKIALLLTQIGLAGAPNLETSSATLPWRSTAADLAQTLLPAEAHQLVASSQRVVIIPNGNLWYLPFDLLPATEADPRTPLLARHPICYVPTLAHVPQIQGAAPVITNCVGVCNSFFAADRVTNQTLCSQIGPTRNALRIDTQQKPASINPNWLRLRADQLWVACELPMAKTPWELRLIPLEPGQDNILANWMQAPLRVPARLFLPGLQSSAQRAEMNGGNDVFVPACTLMASGVRSVWFSRWKVGGRSAHKALARVMDELEYESPSAAWQRAAIALWAEKLATAEEPSIPGAKALPATVDGKHPLLWSGYMMIGDYKPPR